MKNRVGTLYGKPVVIGDKNLVTDNEIHVSNLSNNSSGDSGSGGSGIKYYKLVDTLTDNDTSALGVIGFSVAYIKWKITDGTYEVSPGMGVAPKDVERPVMIMVGKFSYHSEAIPGEDKINSIDYLLSIAGIKYSDLIEKEVSEEEFYEGVEL